MDHTTRIAFLSDLRDLLLRYEAEISVDYDDASDLQGVTGEAMSVSMGKTERFHGRPTFTLGDGWREDRYLRLHRYALAPE